MIHAQNLPKDKTDYPGPSIVYGIIRGCGEIINLCEVKHYDYWHIDNGYMNRHSYYRVSENGLQAPLGRSADSKRFESLGIRTRPWNNGSYILLCPPTPFIQAHYRLYDWRHQVERELSGWTDRDIRVRTKADTEPIDWNNVYCVVTFNSNVGLEALINGVPAIATGPTPWASFCAMNLKHIESLNRPDREPLLNYLANNQFTLDEMRSGYAWECVR